jgi:hypothetical protein
MTFIRDIEEVLRDTPLKYKYRLGQYVLYSPLDSEGVVWVRNLEEVYAAVDVLAHRHEELKKHEDDWMTDRNHPDWIPF